MRLMGNDTIYSPSILLVHIGRHYNDSSKVDISDMIKVESKHVVYTLSAIIAHSEDHYMYLCKKKMKING